jgi:hypothetical protein
MQSELQQLLDHFANIHGVKGAPFLPLHLDFQSGSHKRPAPLRNERAVYLFFQEGAWLRIGQTGYSPRFTSQHYGTRRAGSNFALDIWKNRREFGYTGQEDDISNWIFENFGRANIRVPQVFGPELTQLLEAFLHMNLKPRFEGRRRS